MPTLITTAVTGLAGTAVTGMLLMGQPWADDDDPVIRREVVVGNQEVEESDDEPTDDLTQDTNPGNSNPSRAARVSRATGASRDRDVSVDAAPTSGVTHGTVSGGAGTHDGRIGSGGGDASRDISRGSGDNSGNSRSRG